MESMKVGSSNVGQKKAKDIRKWFDTCLDQIDKLQASLSAEFDG
jgi:ribosome assembly protein YihI (activator of Der GTPase)